MKSCAAPGDAPGRRRRSPAAAAQVVEAGPFAKSSLPCLAAWVVVAKGSFCSTQLRHSWLHDSALEQVLNGNLRVAWEGSASVVMRDEGRNERSSGGHRSGSPPAVQQSALR